MLDEFSEKADTHKSDSNDRRDIEQHLAGIDVEPKRYAAPYVSAEVQDLVIGIEESNEKIRAQLHGESANSEKRRIKAMNRSTGEIVGYEMFRKSFNVRNHEKRRTNAPVDSSRAFSKEDIEAEFEEEGKDYYATKDEAHAKELEVHQLIEEIRQKPQGPHHGLSSESSEQAQPTQMQNITGRAVDYGLDLKVNLETINQSLSRVYLDDGPGNSCLSMLKPWEIKKLYPVQSSRLNFISLIENELSYERMLVYQSIIQRQMSTGDGENPLDSVGYLDRLLMYLLDKLLMAIFCSFQMLRRQIENQNKNLRPVMKNPYSELKVTLAPPSWVYLN